MIPIRLLNGSTIYLNADLVESIAAAPDTIITLISGRKIVASTSPEDIRKAVLRYQRRIHRPPRTARRDAAPEVGVSAG